MIKNIHFISFYNALADGNKYRCQQIVDQLVSDSTDIKDIYVELFQKSLYRVGKLWEEGKITIAEEHLASAIIEHLIDYTFWKQPPVTRIGKTIILSCINKEFHDIGIRMASYIFEMNGWDTHFLGANTPSKEIIRITGQKQPDMIGLSFSFYMNIARLTEVLDSITSEFPKQKIILGGQGFGKETGEILSGYKNLFYFKSVYELDDFIKSESVPRKKSKIKA